ncbi:MAG: endopeptidase [Gaiellales bacterium]|nr:endopeptidase [Gaiellales bacterium]
MTPPETDILRQHEARTYGRARRKLGVADTLAGLAALIAVVVWADTLGGWGAVVALAIVLPAISLPFSYAGYRLSRLHGMSRQTIRGWLADQAKARMLGLLLGGSAALGMLAAQRLSEDWWPVPAWVAAMVLVVALSVLWPVLLLPLFLKSEPLADGPLADELWQTVRDTGVPVREMRLLHMGEKTSAANAMVAGLGPTLRVYVGDTIADGEDQETALTDTRLVLAHELGHHARRDVWRMLGWTAISMAVGLAGAWLAVRELSPDGPGHLTALPALVLGFSLATAVIGPIGAAYSRRRERAADAYAVDVTGEGDRYAQTFERLVSQNLLELRPPRLWHALTASHPMPADRIAAARRAHP